MRRLLSSVLLSLATTSPALACSCIATPPCHPVTHGDVLFRGRVTAREVISEPASVEDESAAQVRRALFHIIVLETFAGPQHVGDEVLVRTGLGGGDCGYPFRKNEVYLVDAYRQNNNPGAGLSTGTCTITGPDLARTAVLRQLRARAAGDRLPDLTGQLSTGIEHLNDPPYSFKPLPRIPVKLTRANDGAVLTTATDQDGVYTVPLLAPGTYSLTLALPSGLTTWEAETGKAGVSIVVPDAHGASAACVVDLHALSTGSIDGAVMDQEGRPVDGTVIASRVDSGQTATSAPVRALDGDFHLSLLPAGTYRLALAPHGNFRDLWFYPGTLEQNAAAIMDVGEGEHVKNVRFIVPTSGTAPAYERHP